jgi:hypothetical protein
MQQQQYQKKKNHIKGMMELQNTELEELCDKNESNWCKLWDFHHQLWKAKEAMGSAANLKQLQAKLQECNHAAMGGGGGGGGGGAAAVESATIQTKLEGSRQELKSKTEALKNSEAMRLRLEGQSADAKAACNKFSEEATCTMMHDFVVLLGKEEKEELLEQYGETLKIELGNSKQAREASEQPIKGDY